ncbi:MAG: hypothetical protein M1383_05415 [Patescibacteria group bacterium]|nr:hypothetical protein [Patescibacteria group bacterium]
MASKNILLISDDVLEELTEYRHLLGFAEKYRMNNTQFLRFMSLAQSSSEATKQQLRQPKPKSGRRSLYSKLNFIFDLDQLARDIVSGQIPEGKI